MSSKTGRKSTARRVLTLVLGLALLAALWLALSALFSASPPIHYVTSCSMYPQYDQGDALLVVPVLPDVPVMDCPECSASQTIWAVDFAGQRGAELNESLATYCANRATLMCQYFLQMPGEFSETSSNVTFYFASCNRTLAGVTDRTPCVAFAGPSNLTVAITQDNGRLVIVNERLSEDQPTMPVVHRAYFAVRDSSGKVSYYTKGDANPLFDSQTAGYARLNNALAANASSVRATVLLKLPLLGDALRALRNIRGCGEGALVRS